MNKPTTYITSVLGVGPYCIEFPDGEIITTRSEERQRQIARMLGWSYEGRLSQGGYFTGWWKDDTPHVGVPLYMQNVGLCLRDILPEIVRRGYQVVILFGDFGAHVQLLDPRRVVEAWECIDSPSIARAICEALVMTEGKK